MTRSTARVPLKEDLLDAYGIEVRRWDHVKIAPCEHDVWIATEGPMAAEFLRAYGAVDLNPTHSNTRCSAARLVISPHASRMKWIGRGSIPGASTDGATWSATLTC